MSIPKWLWWIAVGIFVGTATILSCNTTQSTAGIQFNEDIRPIINEKCISCHGGVKESGQLSFLTRAEALDTTESGKTFDYSRPSG